jgi:ABC-type Fe3+-hydroxamate transport system substrate-binding protein
MPSDDTSDGRPTRREYVKYGGAVLGGGLFAGCTASSGSDSPTPAGDTETTAAEEQTTTGTTTVEDTGYSVTMSPVGTVKFDSVPEVAAVYSDHDADYLVALGQQDRINSLGFTDYYSGYYDQLPGVAFDTSGLTALYNDGIDKEVFYELDSDVHHIDPVWMARWSGFSDADFEEIRDNVAPFFANYLSRSHNHSPDDYDYTGEGGYEYYTIWEILDKYAQVYQVRERGKAMKAVRDEMVEAVHAELPPQEDRPRVGLVVYNRKEETFTIYRLNGPGFGKAHTRPLRANDGLGMYEAGPESGWETAPIDMEAMLEADPDVLLHNFDWTGVRDRTEAFFALDEHPVGTELTAVRNDRLYATGSGLQGPIMNIFQIEIAAKQIYPDLFGQPPEPGEAVPEGEQLFDRQRVAAIANGDF